MASQYTRVCLSEKPSRSEEERISHEWGEQQVFNRETRATAKSNTRRCTWLIHAGLLVLSSTLFACAHFTRLSTLRHVQQFSAYSPAAGAVEYERIKFNLSMDHKSAFVGYGPEVDKAWLDSFYTVGDQMITPDELEKLDMPTSSLRVTHPTTGASGYRVGLEVFHQLHCLNILRQVTYRDWYSDISGNFADGPEALQMHTDHCIEVLRQNVQCNADVGLFTFYMLPGDPLPWPELNSWHTCRRFDKVRDWAMENSVGNMEKDVELAL